MLRIKIEREGGKMCGRGSYTGRAFRDVVRWELHGTLKVMGIEPVLSRVRGGGWTQADVGASRRTWHRKTGEDRKSGHIGLCVKVGASVV